MSNVKRKYDASLPKRLFNKVNSMPWIGRRNICKVEQQLLVRRVFIGMVIVVLQVREVQRVASTKSRQEYNCYKNLLPILILLINEPLQRNNLNKKFIIKTQIISSIPQLHSKCMNTEISRNFQ